MTRPITASDHNATVDRGSAKRARRPRQPAPRRWTPLGSIRKFNELVTKLTAELGREPVNLVERELIRQAAALLLKAEQLQAGVVNGELVDADELIRLCGEARRIVASLHKRAAAEPVRVPLREQEYDEAL
jgi:hypothetical protein